MNQAIGLSTHGLARSSVWGAFAFGLLLSIYFVLLTLISGWATLRADTIARACCGLMPSSLKLANSSYGSCVRANLRRGCSAGISQCSADCGAGFAEGRGVRC